MRIRRFNEASNFIINLEEFALNFFINDEENGVLKVRVNEADGFGVIELELLKLWHEVSDMILNFIELTEEYYQIECLMSYTTFGTNVFSDANDVRYGITANYPIEYFKIKVQIV